MDVAHEFTQTGNMAERAPSSVEMTTVHAHAAGQEHADTLTKGSADELAGEHRALHDAGSSGKLVHELSLRDDRIRSLVGLELPVYATNIERVLETVGGMGHLQRTHESKSQFLPVKLRPTEPSCKPLFADLTKTQTILLRVKRKHKAPREGEAQQQSGSVDADIVGIVREKYVCEGMADFQYFTSRTFYPTTDEPQLEGNKNSSSALQAGASERDVETDSSICKGSPTQLALKASLRPYLRVQSESELEMIPEVFSKVDLPLKYEFRQRSGYQPTEATKKASSTMTYLNFHDDVPAPAEPKPENPVVRRRPVGANEAVDEHVLRMLQEKLAEKPIWLRPKLFVGLDFLERRAARRILRKLCYVFVDGPWRGSWIRMGYDPRKSSDSAKYQVIELRNNRELVHAKVTHPSRKRTKKFSGINPKGPRIVKVTQTSENENAQASKRRRKERFLRGETRRSYLVDAEGHGEPVHSDGAGAEREHTKADDISNEWDSENEQDLLGDNDNDAASVTSSVTSTARVDDEGTHHSPASTPAPAHAPRSNGEKTFEIFGVPLTSANVLFQLDEIDDEEVRGWTSQFGMLEKPSLLGGWFSTHMFLPLREIIRYRIAALVGRSKADLDTRRKRIEALKKQALTDYADQLVNGQKDKAKGIGAAGGTGDAAAAAGATTLAEDDEQAAFEESLVRENAVSHVTRASEDPAVAVPADGEEGRDDLDFDEEDEIEEEEEDGGVEDAVDEFEGGDDDDDDESVRQDHSDEERDHPVAQQDTLSLATSTSGTADTAHSDANTASQAAMEYSF